MFMVARVFSPANNKSFTCSSEIEVKLFISRMLCTRTDQAIVKLIGYFKIIGCTILSCSWTSQGTFLAMYIYHGRADYIIFGCVELEKTFPKIPLHLQPRISAKKVQAHFGMPA